MSDASRKTMIESRAELSAILRSAGIARAAAERIAEGGWSALLENAPDQLKPQYRDRIEAGKMGIQDLRELRGEKVRALETLINRKDYDPKKDQARYDALMAEVDKIDSQIRRHHEENERIVAAANRVSSVRSGDREYSEAFNSFLRNPKNLRVRQDLTDLSFRNAASGGSDAAGGYLIPDVILGPLMKRAADINPFRDLVRVVQVATRDVTFPLSNADMATGWVGENATRTGTAEPTVTGARPTFGILYAYPEASEELVMDSQFDIESWFTMEAGDKMGEAEMAAIVSGNGTDKPSGLLKVAPESAADGSRTAGSLRYLPTGNASTLGAAPADLLISLVYDLKASYRTRATWVMNSTVAGEIRKLKDSQGRFLWTDGIAAGEAATLLGYPVRIAESMPGVAANAHPILFGDFSRGYVLCENGGLFVTVDDNITTPGKVKWYLRRRLGGCVYDNNAIRAIKVATT